MLGIRLFPFEGQPYFHGAKMLVSGSVYRVPFIYLCFFRHLTHQLGQKLSPTKKWKNNFLAGYLHQTISKGWFSAGLWVDNLNKNNSMMRLNMPCPPPQKKKFLRLANPYCAHRSIWSCIVMQLQATSFRIRAQLDWPVLKVDLWRLQLMWRPTRTQLEGLLFFKWAMKKGTLVVEVIDVIVGYTTQLYGDYNKHWQ